MDLTGDGDYDRYQMPGAGTAADSDRGWHKETRDEQGVTKEFGGEQVHQQDPTWLGELTGDRELYSSAQLISQQIRGKEQYTAIINIKSESGDYNREQFGKIFSDVKTSGPVKVTGNPTTTVKLAAKQRTSMALALDAGGAGTANLDVDIKGPNGLTLARHYALDVKAATQVLARRSIRTLAKGESLTLTSDMFSDLVSGTGSVSLSVGLSTALDAATILKALDRYPHGCSEQITSRAMPLLYVNDLAAGAHLAMDTAVDQRIKDAIERLLARQGSNGSFGLWSAGGDDTWLDAYVTDFLTRAREKGFAVPDVLFKNALDRIRNSVVNANEPEKDGGRDLAYGLYVLARNGTAPIGDLRYLADTKLNNLATPIAKSQLAAALALVGDKGRAERVYTAALDALAPKPAIEFGRVDYGSALRDAAALVSLAGEGNAPRATLTGAVQRVEAARGLSPYTSTQENAWMVLAARALANLHVLDHGAAVGSRWTRPGRNRSGVRGHHAREGSTPGRHPPAFGWRRLGL
jgi:uncharacterized protein YfaS (alpha-2-macroglobulin family)